MLHEHRATVDEAIAAGKFPESRRAHYERLMACDTAGTRRLIASLEPAAFVQATNAGGVPERQSHALITSDAGRRIVASSLGGYVVKTEAAASVSVATSPIDQSTAMPERVGVIRHRSTFAIPLSEAGEPVEGRDYLRGNGPPTLEVQAAALEALGNDAHPAAWFPQHRDEPRVENRD